MSCIPKWYDNINVYINLCNKLLKYYDELKSLEFEERFNNAFCPVDNFIEISSVISRIIPYGIDEFDKKCSIRKNENIDYFSKYIFDIRDNVKRIVEQYMSILFSLGALRNKYEHTPHFVNSPLAGGSNNDFYITFKLQYRKAVIIKLFPDKEFDLEKLPTYEIQIKFSELEKLIFEIINLTKKIVNIISQNIKKDHTELLEHPYYKKLIIFLDERSNKNIENI